MADINEVPTSSAPTASEEQREDRPQRESPARILLIRHGLNDYVKERRLAGRTPGVHLNEEGRIQVEALAERLSATSIAAVYSSPLERARETAEPLAARLGLAAQILEGATESGSGDWTGRLIEELSKGDLWRQVQVCPSAFRFPAGESFAEIQARMVATLDGLWAAHPGQTVAMVSHADPIKLAVAFYTGVPLDLFQRFVVAPASITELEFTAFRPLLVRLNDTAHLPAAHVSLEAERKGQ